MNKRRIWLWLLAALSLAGLLAWALARPPIAVQVAKLRRGHFEQVIEEDGKARVRERYLVTAPLSGRIARMGWKPGDAVAAGQVLATLTPAAPALIDARARQQLTERVGAAEAQWERARSEQAHAAALVRQREAEVARVAKLAQEGFLPPAELERADLQVQLGRKALDAARQAVHVAEHDRGNALAALRQSRRSLAGETWQVRAPVAAVVLRVLQENEGSIVQGTPLLELGNPAQLEVVADVLTTDAVQIAPGNTVWIERWGGSQALRGQLRRVEPSGFTKMSVLGVEEQRVNVLVDLVPGPDEAARLRDGFRVAVRIVVHQEDQALLLPLGALFRQGEQWAVYAVEGGRARLHTVRLGRRSEREAVLLDGLPPGGLVILYPPETLADGTRVKVDTP